MMIIKKLRQLTHPRCFIGSHPPCRWRPLSRQWLWFGSLAVLVLGGCEHDCHRSDGSIWRQREERWQATAQRGPQLPPASLAAAERVERIGRQILARYPFAGIEPLFFTVGVDEPLLFHRGSEQLVISEGLVRRCAGDAELAAVLCRELGAMIAEHRVNRRLDADPIPEVGLPGTSAPAGGAAFDTARAAELARAEQRRQQRRKHLPTDPAAISQELLEHAGYPQEVFERVQPLLREVRHGSAIETQLQHATPPPVWSR